MDAGSAEHRRAGQASVPHAHSGLRHQAGRDERAPTARATTPYMSFGLMGGAMQAQGHAQFLINMLVFGMDVQEAMDVGRFRHESGMRVIVESVDSGQRHRAAQGDGPRGHASRGASQFGGSQAIIKLLKGYVAGSDPRKDGHAAGY